MTTLKTRLTRGDHSTKPGGVILRQRRDGGYVTHQFTRQPGSREPEAFFWGHYFEADQLKDAEYDFAERVGNALKYSAGGSLIPALAEDLELSKEIRP